MRGWVLAEPIMVVISKYAYLEPPCWMPLPCTAIYIYYFSIKLRKNKTTKDIHCAHICRWVLFYYYIPSAIAFLNIQPEPSVIEIVCIHMYNHTHTHSKEDMQCLHSGHNFWTQYWNIWCGKQEKHCFIWENHTYQRKKSMDNKLESKVFHVRNFNKQIFAFLLKRETNIKSSH